MKTSPYSNHSRLQKIEERKNKRQALLFTGLTITFLLLLVFVGFPTFIRLIGTLGDVRSSKTSPEKSDTVAPVAPTIMADWESTTSAKTTIRGFAEPGTKVVLKENGIQQGETMVSEDGTYKFDITLEQGDNEIITFSTDLSGNKSQDSNLLNILYDNEPPQLEVTDPDDGAKYYDEKEIIVAGKTDIDATIRVNGFIATVDTEGNFARRIQLNNGDNEITVESTDEAGNKTEKKIKVSYNP